MMPRGIRNNNPGNLDYAGQPGAHLETGVANPRFAAFPTMADGIRALRDQLLRYAERGLDTVSKIIAVYAPPTENSTSSYVSAVARGLGVNPDTILDLDDQKVMAGLTLAITGMENGHGWISVPEINQALGVATF